MHSGAICAQHTKDITFESLTQRNHPLIKPMERKINSQQNSIYINRENIFISIQYLQTKDVIQTSSNYTKYIKLSINNNEFKLKIMNII